MAYPVVDGPYGLIPVNLIGGQSFAGSTRMIPIASGYATSLYFGDPVKFTSDGTLITSGIGATTAAAETGGTLGIFLGCEYSQSSGPIYGKLRAQRWVGGTVAPDAVAYVVDDYDALFKAAIIEYNASTGPVIAAAPAAALGTNLTSMSTANANTGTTSGNLVGNSSVGLMLASGNVRRTATAPFRIVRMVPETRLTTVVTASTTNASTAVVLSAANSAVKAGMLVTGTGIAAGTYVAAVSGTSVTLSANATATGSAALTFDGFQEVLVKWNFGYHAYQTAVAI